MRKDHITHSRLLEVLRYEPESGNWFWVNPDRTHRGAGPKLSLTKKGYQIVKIDGKAYFSHRLAWMYITGAEPSLEIDHKNQVKNDNRFCNLREATRSQNQANISTYRTSTTGFKGVTWHKEGRKFQSAIKVGGKCIYLGLFAKAEEAHEAYKSASQKFFGDFSGVRA